MILYYNSVVTGNSKSSVKTMVVILYLHGNLKKLSYKR